MKKSCHGFSLIELVIFIVIVSIAVAAISQIYTVNTQHSAEPILREKALKIANLYIEEIASKRWDENTPATGGCIETGSNYCTNYCAALTFPKCGSCAIGVATCQPAATIASLGSNEETKRSDFDDVDDYNATSLSTTPSYPDSGGANGESPLPDSNGFSVSVSVSETALGTTAASDSRRIVVSVSTPNGETLTLTRYRINF